MNISNGKINAEFQVTLHQLKSRTHLLSPCHPPSSMLQFLSKVLLRPLFFETAPRAPPSQAALAAWLDSESNFRLTVEKAKEATDGAAYAREQYEKYHTAYLSAKSTYDSILAQNAEERNGLLDERELIKEIMRMIGPPPPRIRRMRWQIMVPAQPYLFVRLLSSLAPSILHSPPDIQSNVK
jgi:hypothetical protein